MEKDRARLWKPVKEGGVSLFKAEFQTFSFKKHSHDDYALGVIEAGTQRFSFKGGTCVAPARALITVNPGEVHDGEPADSGGYRYRNTYFPDQTLREVLSGLYGHKNAVSYFKKPVTFDKELASALVYAHELMEKSDNNLLEAETALMQVIAEVFIRHGEERGSLQKAPRNLDAVKKAISYIRKNAADNISLDDISAAAGLSRYHFLRQFKATTGLPPHAYLMQCRIYLARKAIDQGVSLSEAALQTGFSDQAHLSRSFKAIHGLSPGVYQHGFAITRSNKKYTS